MILEFFQLLMVCRFFVYRKHPQIPILLEHLRSNDKKVFLITNSPFDFVDKGASIDYSVLDFILQNALADKSKNGNSFPSVYCSNNQSSLFPFVHFPSKAWNTSLVKDGKSYLTSSYYWRENQSFSPGRRGLLGENDGPSNSVLPLQLLFDQVNYDPEMSLFILFTGNTNPVVACIGSKFRLLKRASFTFKAIWSCSVIWLAGRDPEYFTLAITCTPIWLTPRCSMDGEPPPSFRKLKTRWYGYV